MHVKTHRYHRGDDGYDLLMGMTGIRSRLQKSDHKGHFRPKAIPFSQYVGACEIRGAIPENISKTFSDFTKPRARSRCLTFKLHEDGSDERIIASVDSIAVEISFFFSLSQQLWSCVCRSSPTLRKVSDPSVCPSRRASSLRC